jgi:hypothetical protein
MHKKPLSIMSRIYSEDDVSWSSIESIIPYDKVEWYIHKNGISTYKFFNKECKKIDINNYIGEIFK